MRKVKIISDSSCDLTNEMIARYDIGIIPYSVSFDGQTYVKEYLEITNAEFYKTLRTKNVYPKTSLPTPYVYEQAIREYIALDMDIVVICLTDKFSGSYQSAHSAAELLNNEFNEKRVYAVNSIQATIAQGAIVLEAAKMKDAGFSAADIANKLEVLKQTCILYLTVDSLTYLQKGGRVGKANALAGSILNIKPVIVLREGELLPLAKVRGRKKALAQVMEHVKEETAANPGDYEFFIGQADVLEEAEQCVALLESEHGIKLSYPIMEVGVTIGAHIGPTAMGIGYIKKYTLI